MTAGVNGMPYAIEKVGIERAHDVFEGVARLLAELGEEGDELGALDRPALLAAWAAEGERFHAFLATDETGDPVGVLTLVETFAIYAGGLHGIINEMFVSAAARSRGVGAALVDAACAHGRARGWRRVEVTAPESDRWRRTRAFYERQGFVFAGPKLKRLLR
jgi:GNAT superfamily N-acetyltransferase